jgi:hypothetical protein
MDVLPRKIQRVPMQSIVSGAQPSGHGSQMLLPDPDRRGVSAARQNAGPAASLRAPARRDDDSAIRLTATELSPTIVERTAIEGLAMLRVWCISCGVDGILLADDSRDIPRCLQCGRPFQVQEAAPEKRQRQEPICAKPTEDLIATWLIEGPPLPAKPKSFDFVCHCCGHAGPKPRRDRFGALACPACGELDRPPRRRGRSQTVCLNCGLLFELSARDRGRTILCPGCNYFLGCLLPVERQRHRPFWGRG